jgi:hypothetical protein
MEFNAETSAFIVLTAGGVLLISGILVALGIQLLRSGQSARGIALVIAVVAWLGGPLMLSWLSRFPLLPVVAFSTAWLLSAGLMWFVGFAPDRKWRLVGAPAAITTCLAFDVLFKHVRPSSVDEDLAALIGAILGAAVSAVLIAKSWGPRGRGRAAQPAIAPDGPAAGTS